MKNRIFLILMSIIATLLLAACGNSSPTQTGVSTPTSRPATGESTSESSSQSSSQQLSLSVSSSATDNSATINVQTLPGAAITIDLNYCGQDTKKTEHADSTGNYTLNWTPDKKCGGMATATVTASADGQSSTSSTRFSVS
jgi:outer membrane biogenesis lipoprotein LolB